MAASSAPDRVPTEVLQMIFTKLTPRARLLCLSRVCKRWNRIARASISDLAFLCADIQRINAALRILPSVTDIGCYLRPEVTPPSSLLKAHVITRLYSDTAYSALLSSLLTSLSSLRMEGLSPLALSNKASLTSLSLRSWETSLVSLNLLFSVHFPALRSVQIHMDGVAYFPWIELHLTQLHSLKIEYLSTSFQVPARVSKLSLLALHLDGRTEPVEKTLKEFLPRLTDGARVSVKFSPAVASMLTLEISAALLLDLYVRSSDTIGIMLRDLLCNTRHTIVGFHSLDMATAVSLIHEIHSTLTTLDAYPGDLLDVKQLPRLESLHVNATLSFCLSNQPIAALLQTLPRHFPRLRLLCFDALVSAGTENAATTLVLLQWWSAQGITFVSHDNVHKDQAIEQLRKLSATEPWLLFQEKTDDSWQ